MKLNKKEAIKLLKGSDDFHYTKKSSNSLISFTINQHINDAPETLLYTPRHLTEVEIQSLLSCVKAFWVDNYIPRENIIPILVPIGLVNNKYITEEDAIPMLLIKVHTSVKNKIVPELEEIIGKNDIDYYQLVWPDKDLLFPLDYTIARTTVSKSAKYDFVKYPQVIYNNIN